MIGREFSNKGFPKGLVLSVNRYKNIRYRLPIAIFAQKWALLESLLPQDYVNSQKPTKLNEKSKSVRENIHYQYMDSRIQLPPTINLLIRGVRISIAILFSLLCGATKILQYTFIVNILTVSGSLHGDIELFYGRRTPRSNVQAPSLLQSSAMAINETAFKLQRFSANCTIAGEIHTLCIRALCKMSSPFSRNNYSRPIHRYATLNPDDNSVEIISF